eukprot:TRINITY_DN109091_c0_g1_i1.p1 TRINITY_DN109091_c0_g1~~TRINITY_DN109091_c0_g1_i1.p1  ORF type:complete len:525 (+),score=82.06 TRINITY_DN109091_c0_g1_i1:68-1576(+)
MASNSKVYEAVSDLECGTAASSWAVDLYDALEATPLVTTVQEAVSPIAKLEPGWNQAKFDRRMSTFERVVKDDLKKLSDKYREPSFLTYKHEHAKIIHAYSLQDPAIYRMCMRPMVANDRRQTGGGVSREVRAALVFYKALMFACYCLPECLRSTGRRYRGVKWVYPSPADHNPEKHFLQGHTFFWFEPKSTACAQEVMEQDYFCGQSNIDVDGNLNGRTIFIIDDAHGFDITPFSAFGDGEQERLIAMLSVFEVQKCAKLCNLTSGGFPDMVFLKQLDYPELSVAKLLQTPSSSAAPASLGGYRASAPSKAEEVAKEKTKDDAHKNTSRMQQRPKLKLKQNTQIAIDDAGGSEHPPRLPPQSKYRVLIISAGGSGKGNFSSNGSRGDIIVKTIETNSKGKLSVIVGRGDGARDSRIEGSFTTLSSDYVSPGHRLLNQFTTAIAVGDGGHGNNPGLMIAGDNPNNGGAFGTGASGYGAGGHAEGFWGGECWGVDGCVLFEPC